MYFDEEIGLCYVRTDIIVVIQVFLYRKTLLVWQVATQLCMGTHNPTVALTKEQYDVTKAVYRDWLKEKTGKPVGGKVDWTKVSAKEAQQLAERMFDAAKVPQHTRDEYYRKFNQYIYSGCKG